MGENERDNEIIDQIHKRINEMKDDFKSHCKDADYRLRHLEDNAVKSDVLLEQFVKMQAKQTETNEKLNGTLITVNSSITQMNKSMEDLFKRAEKNENDIICIKSETIQIPELKDKINENERKHKVDLRDIDNQIVAGDIKTNWRKPAAIAGGTIGGVSVIALLYKLFEVLQQLMSKLPQ